MTDLLDDWTPERLRLARLAKSLSRTEAALLAEIDIDVLTSIESGDIALDAFTLKKLLIVLVAA